MRTLLATIAIMLIAGLLVSYQQTEAPSRLAASLSQMVATTAASLRRTQETTSDAADDSADDDLDPEGDDDDTWADEQWDDDGPLDEEPWGDIPGYGINEDDDNYDSANRL